jgi:hypothetical protein
MKQSLPLRCGKMFSIAVLSVWTLVQGANSAAQNVVTARKNPEQIFREMAAAVDRLNPLALRFDADHDRVLSPQEQEEMIAFVAAKNGRQQAERLKAFLHAADTNHDGKVSQEEAQALVNRLTPASASSASSNGNLVNQLV